MGSLYLFIIYIIKELQPITKKTELENPAVSHGTTKKQKLEINLSNE
jgi:hypothetical protein